MLRGPLRVASHSVVSSIGSIGGGLSPPLLFHRQSLLFYIDLTDFGFSHFLRLVGLGAGGGGRGAIAIYIYIHHRGQGREGVGSWHFKRVFD